MNSYFKHQMRIWFLIAESEVFQSILLINKYKVFMIIDFAYFKIIKSE